MARTVRRRLRLDTIAISLANVLVTLFILGPVFLLFLGAIQTEKSLVEDYMRLIPTQVTLRILKSSSWAGRTSSTTRASTTCRGSSLSSSGSS